MRRLHTDREILRCIFDMYREDYPSKGEVWLPVDVTRIARALGSEPNLIFGRLYHDIAKRLRTRNPGNPNQIELSIFELKVGSQMHCINFPFVVGELSRLEAEEHRNQWALRLAVAAIIVSVAGIAVQVAVT